jgi:hypothetical protein
MTKNSCGICGEPAEREHVVNCEGESGCLDHKVVCNRDVCLDCLIGLLAAKRSAKRKVEFAENELKQAEEALKKAKEEAGHRILAILGNQGPAFIPKIDSMTSP